MVKIGFTSLALAMTIYAGELTDNICLLKIRAHKDKDVERLLEYKGLHFVFKENMGADSVDYYYTHCDSYDGFAKRVLLYTKGRKVTYSDSTQYYLEQTVFHQETHCKQYSVDNTLRFELIHKDSVWMFGEGECVDHTYNGRPYRYQSVRIVK